MTLGECWGNTHFKWFAHHGMSYNFIHGLLGYAIVIFFLIQSFGSKKGLIWVTCMWESMILIGGVLLGYFLFGESLKHWTQWIAIGLAMLAMWLMHCEGEF